MPERASRSEASTSCVLLPMDDTMPMPVTTTRLMARFPSYPCPGPRRGRPSSLAGAASGLLRARLEQSDPQVLGLVDAAPVRLEPAIGDAEDELGAEHALEVDAVDDLLYRRQDLVCELDFPNAQRAAASL